VNVDETFFVTLCNIFLTILWTYVIDQHLCNVYLMVNWLPSTPMLIGPGIF